MVIAGEAGTKPAHHSRIEMPARAIYRTCGVLYITLGTSVSGKWYVRLSSVNLVQARLLVSCTHPMNALDNKLAA
jgi:hypothetical protein